MIKKRLLATLLLVAIAVVIAGCSAPTPSTPSGGSGSATPPTMKLVKPTSGETLPAGDVVVEVETTGHEFVMPSNTNVAGQGHVHFTLDDEPFEMSVEPSYTFKDVAPGTHKLRAELVQNNTEPFDPPIVEEITFEVE